ncbi:uncharacterized protein LOC134665156 [Cydia fagiglandana]|uniref:uncharacterized protein LOC134665156 n=1 Tax=Cydia fagiglandana TaxID=1458189 RepID=UPI002FEE13AA
MGNSKSVKKSQKEPDKFFEREKWREQKREERRKKNANPGNRRFATKEGPVPTTMQLASAPRASTGHAPGPAPAHVRSYDDEALDHMRYQLQNDSEAFLLNNILLSVQFFENFEREMYQIKNNPMSEREHGIDEAMVRHHKHVFFADRLQECVQEHVYYRKQRGHREPLLAPRLYVIYDNIEAREPGDTSDYSAVLDAPFYKLRVEDCREPGYVKLKKLEVLESCLSKEAQEEEHRDSFMNSDDSLYTDSEKESNGSDDAPSVGKGEELLQKLKNKIESKNASTFIIPNAKINQHIVNDTGRRRSGPIKPITSSGNISNMKAIKLTTQSLLEEVETENIFKAENKDKETNEIKGRKSILKTSRSLSGPVKDIKGIGNPIRLDNTIAEDTETSGYRSTSSSRQEYENDSDYGYATIKESTTPKKVEITSQSNYALSSGVVPDECWTSVQIRSFENWSEDEDEEIDDADSKLSPCRNLFETHHYLKSTSFMANFVDNFMIKLGSSLGLTPDSVNNAMTQGASIYCDMIKNGVKMSYEVFPALFTSWPNAANRWIIRERRRVINPRTNFAYQWPSKNVVNKAINFGCLLVPVGFRPKRGLNPDQKLQWRVTFPAAERYLESCLAHAHLRCYLFALVLHKTFMENQTSKIGIDANHLKNHLFWQCEDNYARWPEDRLGETFKLFIETFYSNFTQGRFPNYFIDHCNDFKSIPNPLLREVQRQLFDIKESPVMHMLYALEKVKYTKKEFYPKFNCLKLYEILTCRNPLRILNPNLNMPVSNRRTSTDTEDEWENRGMGKMYDKNYLWNKERHRQIQDTKRKGQLYSKKHKTDGKSEKPEILIDKNRILPKKMETERRRLVFEFFIPHFIAMARSSETFGDIRQALIYLEQAQRLCMLLMEEPAGEITANGYLDVIRDKLTDCQRKLVNQVGYRLTPRSEKQVNRKANSHVHPIRKPRHRFEHIINQDSPTDSAGIPAFTFADIEYTGKSSALNLTETYDDEESKL